MHNSDVHRLRCKILFKGELKRIEIRRCYFLRELISQLLLKVHNRCNYKSTERDQPWN